MNNKVQNTVFSKGNLKKCIICVTLPLMGLIPAVIVMYLSGVDHQVYVDRLAIHPGLATKASVNAILGLVGLSIWGFLLFPIGVLTLIHRSSVVSANSEWLYVFGKRICNLHSIRDVEIRKAPFSVRMIVTHENITEYCGNLILCNDVDSLRDSIISYTKKIGGNSNCRLPP